MIFIWDEINLRKKDTTKYLDSLPDLQRKALGKLDKQLIILLLKKEFQTCINGTQNCIVDSEDQKEYLKAEQAADLLGVSVRTLARYRKAKKIEYIQHTDNGSISYNYNSLIRYKDSLDSKNDVSLLLTIFTTSEQK